MLTKRKAPWVVLFLGVFLLPLIFTRLPILHHDSGQTPFPVVNPRTGDTSREGKRATTKTVASSLAMDHGLRFNAHPDEAPDWTIRFGGEFWRLRTSSNAISASPVEFGKAIERVMHAFFPSSSGSDATVRAKSYQASLNLEGLRFFPSAPAIGIDPERPACGTFRTSAIRLAGQSLFTSREPVPARAIIGNTAQTQTS